MEIIIKVNGNKISKMEKDFIIILVNLNTMVILKISSNTDEDNRNLATEISL